MHARELWRELVQRVHEVLDDQEVLLVVDGDGGGRGGRLRLEHWESGRHGGGRKCTMCAWPVLDVRMTRRTSVWVQSSGEIGTARLQDAEDGST